MTLRGVALVALPLIATGAAATSTAAAPGATLRLSCTVSAESEAPDWGRSFAVSIPFGDGGGLALIDPETQAVRRMLYAADVSAGTFAARGEAWPVIWTRANGVRGTLLGQAIRSDGHMVTVIIDRPGAAPSDSTAPDPRPRRAIRLFDTKAGAVFAGGCEQAG